MRNKFAVGAAFSEIILIVRINYTYLNAKLRVKAYLSAYFSIYFQNLDSPREKKRYFALELYLPLPMNEWNLIKS